MVKELPRQLEPLGKLHLFKKSFEYLEQYYREFGDSANPANLSQQAEIHALWALVLRAEGDGDGARKKLDVAVARGAASAALKGAGVEEWLSWLQALHLRGVAAGKEMRFDMAESDLRTAIDSGAKALRRFPGEPALLIEMTTALVAMAAMQIDRATPEDIQRAAETLKSSLQVVLELQGGIRTAAPPGELYLRALRLEALCNFELGRAAEARNAPGESVYYYRRNFELCDQLVNVLPAPLEESRNLCAGCIRLAYALISAAGDANRKAAIEEARPFAERAEKTLSALAAHDRENLFWQVEWGRSAMALAYVEEQYGNHTESRKWLEESLKRLNPVNRAASANVLSMRAAVQSYLARNLAKSNDITGACNYWDQAIATGFEHLLAYPVHEPAHSKWKKLVEEAIGYRRAKALGGIENCLIFWISRLESEFNRPAAPPWWKMNAAGLYRELADRYRDARDMAGAAEANRRALELRSELLLGDGGQRFISEVTSAAKHLVVSYPGADDRKELARLLIRCAGHALVYEPEGPWRTDWGLCIYFAVRQLEGADAATLAGEACAALFPESNTPRRTSEEQNAYDLLRTIQDL